MLIRTEAKENRERWSNFKAMTHLIFCLH